MILTNLLVILYITNVVYHICAALAQSVERRLGKAEVGGSSPLGSFTERRKIKAFRGKLLRKAFII